MEFKEIRESMRMKVRRVRIRFKERNMKDRVKTRKIGEKAKLVGKRGDFLSDREETEMAVVKLIKKASSVDISMKEID